jgi:hypothetical protein
MKPKCLRLIRILESIIEVRSFYYLIQLQVHSSSHCRFPGYSRPSQEKVIQQSDSGDESTIPPPPDMKESFECGSEDNEFLPNIWLPEGVLPGFKEACLSFYWVSVC